MSLQEVLPSNPFNIHLTESEKFEQKFNLDFTSRSNLNTKQIEPILLAMLEGLIRHTVTLCDSKAFGLDSIEAFANQINPWQSKLIQIYKYIYFKDCQQLYKKQKQNKHHQRGLPEDSYFSSKVIKSLLIFLASRNHDSLSHQIHAVTEEVHDAVFGVTQQKSPVIQQPLNTQSTELSTSKSNLKSRIRQQTIAELQIETKVLKRLSPKHPTQEKQQQSRQLLDPDISRLNQTTMLEIKNILLTPNQQPSPKERIRSQKKLYTAEPQIQTYNFGHVYQPEEYPLVKIIKRRQQKSSQSNLYDPNQQDHQTNLNVIEIDETSQSGNKELPVVKARRFSQVNATLPQLNFKATAQQTGFHFPITQGLKKQYLISPKNSETRADQIVISEFPDIEQPQPSPNSSKKIQKLQHQKRYSLKKNNVEIKQKDVKLVGFKSESNQISGIGFSTRSITPNQAQTDETQYNLHVEETDNASKQEDTNTNFKSPTNKKKLVDLQLPSHLHKFNTHADTFQFNTIGLYNTSPELAFYRIEAAIGDERFDFNKPDWSAISQRIWRLIPSQDIKVSASKLSSHSSIIYRVIKYDVSTKVIDQNFGFAVQPLISLVQNQTYLVQGQYQLPVYKGICPQEILKNNQPPIPLIKQLLSSGKIESLGYTQLISRVSILGSKDTYTKLWYPDIEPSVLFITIKHKGLLVKYLLHAKHSKVERTTDSLKVQMGENFQEILDLAKPFFHYQKL